MEAKTMLYNLAKQCAELSAEGNCDQQCQQCTMNVFNYCDDIREASLLKANAQADYSNYNKIKMERRYAEVGGGIAKLVIICVIIGLIMAMCKGC